MITLTRHVRLAFGLRRPSEPAPVPSGVNGYGGVPALGGLPRHYEFEVRCRGEVHPTHQYLVDIKAIDRAVRTAVYPVVDRACQDPAADQLRTALSATTALAAHLGSALAAMRWWLSPFYSLEVEADMPAAVLVRQRFDFAASHRLFVASLSPEENLKLFGKCCHPNGHGHNYQVEPCIEVAVGDGASPPMVLAELERITDRVVIEPFDHKYLNKDTPEFADGVGAVPSVENIARVCFEKLAPEVARMGPRTRLREVTVWESDRTSATYPG